MSNTLNPCPRCEAPTHCVTQCGNCLPANDEPNDEQFCDDGSEFDDTREFEDDGQPDEYTEWQDFIGGDDWDHGQYDFGGEA